MSSVKQQVHRRILPTMRFSVEGGAVAEQHATLILLNVEQSFRPGYQGAVRCVWLADQDHLLQVDIHERSSHQGGAIGRQVPYLSEKSRANIIRDQTPKHHCELMYHVLLVKYMRGKHTEGKAPRKMLLDLAQLAGCSGPEQAENVTVETWFWSHRLLRDTTTPHQERRK